MIECSNPSVPGPPILRRLRSFVTLALSTTLLVLLVGCAAPSSRVAHVDLRSGGPSPHPHAQWVDGQWVYQAGHYHWVKGHWRM